MVGIEAFKVRDFYPETWVDEPIPTDRLAELKLRPSAVDLLNLEGYNLLVYKRQTYGRENILKGDFEGLFVRTRDKIYRLEQQLRCSAEHRAKGIMPLKIADVPNLPNAQIDDIEDTFSDFFGYGQIGRGLLRGFFQLPP